MRSRFADHFQSWLRQQKQSEKNGTHLRNSIKAASHHFVGASTTGAADGIAWKQQKHCYQASDENMVFKTNQRRQKQKPNLS
jgi:hypothetical protein